MLLTAMQGISDSLPRRCPFALLVRNVTTLDIAQKLSESFDGIILLPPLPAFVLRTVECRVVGGGVVSHPVGHELQEVGLPVLDYVVTCESSSLQDSECVVAVHPAASDPEGNCLGDYTV